MKNKKTNNENDKPRYECTNWDEPVVRVEKSGKTNSTITRKVKTIGLARITAPELIKAAVDLLRQGKEVQLLNVKGDPCIRLYPVASTDCSKIYVASQAMEALSQCMVDKTPVVVQGKGKNEEIVSSEKLDAMLIEQKKNHEEYQKRISVTADTVVTCPNCNFEFRVGKQLQ